MSTALGRQLRNLAHYYLNYWFTKIMIGRITTLSLSVIVQTDDSGRDKPEQGRVPGRDSRADWRMPLMVTQAAAQTQWAVVTVKADSDSSSVSDSDGGYHGRRIWLHESCVFKRLS